MAYGLRVYNDTGQVQIDQDYLNPSFKAKGTVSSLTSSQFGYTYLGGNSGFSRSAVFWVVDYTGTTPVIAVRPPDGRQIFVSNLWSEQVTSNPPPAGYKRLVFWSPGTTAATLTWYLFDAIDPGSLPAASYGLAVRNAAGGLVYHSELSVFRPREPVILGSSGVGTSYSKPSTSEYAFVFCNRSRGYYYPASASTRQAQTVGFNPSSSTNVSVVNATNIEGFLLPQSAGALIDFPVPGFMIDVTNL